MFSSSHVDTHYPDMNDNSVRSNHQQTKLPERSKEVPAIQEKKRKFKHWGGGSIHQSAQHMPVSENIETSTRERNILNNTISLSAADLTESAPGNEQCSYQYGPSLGTELDESLDFYPMGFPSPFTQDYDQLMTDHEAIRILDQSHADLKASEEPYGWPNQSANPFAIPQHPSSMGLSPSPFLGSSQDDFLDLEELDSLVNGAVDVLPRMSSDDMLLLNGDSGLFPLEASSISEDELKIKETSMRMSKDKEPGKESDQFEYVLGGIGGEVPLMQ